jgi:uncharacterized damage-inducible protein DinB
MDTATTPIMTTESLLKHWQGHRALTRRVIELFPEEDFFTFTIGGMRTMAQLANEFLAMEAPGLKAIVNREENAYTERGNFKTKAEYLEQWDKDSQDINQYWAQLREEDFGQSFKLFGQYEFPVIQNIFYFIDNEIHHRGQAFVYLRALGITPPFFWDRY